MDAGQHANSGNPGIIRRFFSFLVIIAIVLICSYGIRTYVIEPFEVPSGSMEDTIMTGDMVFAEKVSYLAGSPQQGDIVVFSDPQIPSRVLIKRVVAVGGQTVNLVDGVVYVDGVAQNEPYTQGESYPLSTAGNVYLSYPYTVPSNCVWVMGDNRENSADSRYFGPVKTGTVFGKAIATYWPLNHIGLLE